MEIKLLGTGCPSCIRLAENVKEAVASLQLDVNITKVTEMEDIMMYDVMSMPAVVINEKVVSYGKVLSTEAAKELLTQYS